MNVAELRRLVAELPADLDELPVAAEGCDCIGEAEAIEVETTRIDYPGGLDVKAGGRYVVIARSGSGST